MPIFKNDASYSSGDPNFAAAMMTVGVPPHDPPVRLIAHQDGHDYISFRVRDKALDGTETHTLSQAWSNPSEMQALRACAHPFVMVCDFTRAKPQTGPSREAWIEHLARHAGITIDAAFLIMQDVQNVCKREPESPISYFAAFIENRFYLLDIAKKAQRNGDQSIYMAHGSGMSMIPEKAPTRIKDYLLSKIR